MKLARIEHKGRLAIGKTGTPRAIGPINAADVVEVEIEGIGRLRNPVSAYGGKWLYLETCPFSKIIL
jgi:hypothetical protein